MIYSYTRGKNPVVKYAVGVNFLNKKVTFKKGINIVIGPNGSGKSALLDSLKTLFLAKQQGYTKFNGLSDLGSNCSYRIKKFSDKVEHNGFPIVCDKTYDKGFFDDWNIPASMASIFTQQSKSTGESSKFHLNMINNYIERVQSVDRLIPDFSKNKNSHYIKLASMWCKWFEIGIKVINDILSIIMDEPTKGFDYPSKIEFWNSIFSKKDNKIQYIIATHDIIPLFSTEANIVETNPGYYNDIRKGIWNFFGQRPPNAYDDIV